MPMPMAAGSAMGKRSMSMSMSMRDAKGDGFPGDADEQGPPEGFGFGSVVGIPDIGVIAPGVVEALLGRLSTRVARTLVDARTGVTLETMTPRYRPTEGMRRFVQVRDGTCRFPGCGVQARRCQLDHVVPAPAGPTSPGNLIALCQHHHRLKTFGGWRPVLARDGTVSWTDPYRQAWVTYPVDHLATRAA